MECVRSRTGLVAVVGWSVVGVGQVYWYSRSGGVECGRGKTGLVGVAWGGVW